MADVICSGCEREIIRWENKVNKVKIRF
jgi:hypothetical protein